MKGAGCCEIEFFLIADLDVSCLTGEFSCIVYPLLVLSHSIVFLGERKNAYLLGTSHVDCHDDILQVSVGSH